MMIPEFNENQLDLLKLCILLLVKIENEKSELIAQYIDRYKIVINQKLEEIFSHQEGVSEIDFSTYMKIYSTFEFSINENEFLFYETQINELEKDKDKNLIKDIDNIDLHQSSFKDKEKLFNINGKTIDFKTLSSKYFKKGTMIWIAKKIDENIILSLLTKAYLSFVEIFSLSSVNSYMSLLDYAIENIYSKTNYFLNNNFKNSCEDSGKANDKSYVDSIFLKESIISYDNAFISLFSNNFDRGMNVSSLEDSILKHNKDIITNYFEKSNKIFLKECKECLETVIVKLEANNFLHENTKSMNSRFQRNTVFKLLDDFRVKISNNLLEKTGQIYSLELKKIFKLNDEYYLNEIQKHVINLIEIYMKMFKSKKFFGEILKESKDSLKEYLTSLLSKIKLEVDTINNLNKDSNDNNNYNDDNENNNDNKHVSFNLEYYQSLLESDSLMEIVNSINKKILFFGKINFHMFLFQQNLNPLVDKINKELGIEKNKKNVKNEIKFFIEAKTAEAIIDLQENLIENQSETYFTKLKKIFIENFSIKRDTPISFRKETYKLCLNICIFFKDLDLIYKDKHLKKKGDTLFMKESLKKETQIQMMMNAIVVKKLAVNGSLSASTPQSIIDCLLKILLKNLVELFKIRKQSKDFALQVKYDLFFIKKFIKDYLSSDVDGLLDSFFREMYEVINKNADIDMEGFDQNVSLLILNINILSISTNIAIITIYCRLFLSYILNSIKIITLYLVIIKKVLFR